MQKKKNKKKEEEPDIPINQIHKERLEGDSLYKAQHGAYIHDTELGEHMSQRDEALNLSAPKNEYIDLEIIDDGSEDYLNDLLPKVLRSDLKVYSFDINYVKDRLLIETSISVKNAQKVNKEVVRLVLDFSKKIKVITGPMLRELCNSVLLQYGLEVPRLQNTRVGLPLYELTKIKEQGKSNSKITDHVWKEYENVISIIKTLKEDDADRTKILPKIQKDLI